MNDWVSPQLSVTPRVLSEPFSLNATQSVRRPPGSAFCSPAVTPPQSLGAGPSGPQDPAVQSAVACPALFPHLTPTLAFQSPAWGQCRTWSALSCPSRQERENQRQHHHPGAEKVLLGPGPGHTAQAGQVPQLQRGAAAAPCAWPGFSHQHPQSEENPIVAIPASGES